MNKISTAPLAKFKVKYCQSGKGYYMFVLIPNTLP